MEAAYQACRWFGVTESEARKVIAEFQPLRHRLQKVAEKGGVLYVDDSKATTVDAMAAALRSFDRPVLLLAGGVFKGGDLAALAPLIREKVKAMGLFGGAREVFASALSSATEVFWRPTMAESFRALTARAQAGDVTLLSPATASFDQYADYKARGDEFQRLVAELGDKP